MSINTKYILHHIILAIIFLAVIGGVIFYLITLPREMSWQRQDNRKIYFSQSDTEIWPIREMKVATITAYSPRIEETDNTPRITASNKEVKEGYVANNCANFGDRVEIEGLGVYEVQDRMNSRYGCDRWDIFFENTQEAINFGVKELTVLKY